MTSQRSQPFQLDPIIARAFYLLHSKDKNSAQELRDLVDDAIQAKQTSKGQSSISGSSSSNASTPAKRQTSGQPAGPKYASDDSESGNPPKRPRIDQKSVTGGSTSSSGQNSPNVIHVESDMDSRLISSSTDDNKDDDYDMSMDVEEMGLVCDICRSISVSPRNQLVECHECSKLFHQECHSPPVSDLEINDPRAIWYCSDCSRNMRKAVATKSNPTSKSAPGQNSTTTKSLAPTLEEINIFKRTDSKALPGLTTATTLTTNSRSGMAGLAATIKSSTTTNSKTASSSTVSKSSFSDTKPSSNSMSIKQNCDKRLHQMKKKALQARLETKKKSTK